jgi:hypothetical protein
MPLMTVKIAVLWTMFFLTSIAARWAYGYPLDLGSMIRAAYGALVGCGIALSVPGVLRTVFPESTNEKP